jgi:hypothetical protein
VLLLLLLSLLFLMQETDLVLVEYSLNGCRGRSSKPMCSTITMPRVRSATVAGSNTAHADTVSLMTHYRS